MKSFLIGKEVPADAKPTHAVKAADEQNARTLRDHGGPGRIAPVTLRDLERAGLAQRVADGDDEIDVWAGL